MSYFGFKPYVPVAQRRTNTEKGKSKLEKKLGRPLQPVRSTGRKIVQTWWGKAWNQNLESYSDYANRLPRGRSYLSNGSVLDLEISLGKITALVQGSDTSPYEICITIAPLAAKHRTALTKACAGKLQDIQQLLSGTFPAELGQLFLTKGQGLFPANKEIQIRCDCPDWAGLCKHAAATLYGVGVRLEHNPELFFTLRGLAMEDIVGHVVQNAAQALADKADSADSTDVLALDDLALAQLFGIDFVTDADRPQKAPTKRAAKKKASAPKAMTPLRKTTIQATPQVIQKAAATLKKAASRAAAQKITATSASKKSTANKRSVPR